MVREGYAEVIYVSPSEFDSYEGKEGYTHSPTQTPGFELVFAIIGVLATMCLV